MITNNILLQARATTMMPNKVGLGAMLTMIFAPKVELRVDRTVQRYTGCLVGLGHHAKDHQDNQPKPYAYESPGLTSYNSDHDMELTFDCEISNYDIQLIQKIRFLMNNAFSIDPRKGQGFKKISAENEMIKIQDDIKENLDTLFNKPRYSKSKEFTKDEYKWGQYLAAGGNSKIKFLKKDLNNVPDADQIFKNLRQIDMNVESLEKYSITLEQLNRLV